MDEIFTENIKTQAFYDCFILEMIGYYGIILLMLSFILNPIAFYAFTKIEIKNKNISLHIYVRILVINNLVASIIELPLVIWSNFSCR